MFSLARVLILDSYLYLVNKAGKYEILFIYYSIIHSLLSEIVSHNLSPLSFDIFGLIHSKAFLTVLRVDFKKEYIWYKLLFHLQCFMDGHQGLFQAGQEDVYSAFGKDHPGCCMDKREKSENKWPVRNTLQFPGGKYGNFKEYQSSSEVKWQKLTTFL